MKRSLRSWLWNVPLDQEVDEELAFHREMRAREQRHGTTDPRVRDTLIDLGRKRDREMRLTQWIEECWSDGRFAVRQMRRAQSFTLTAILTLALGIGANAAVFSVVKSVLIDDLPYASAGRLTRLYGRRIDGSQERGPLSAGTVTAIRERQTSFERLTAFVDATSDAVYTTTTGPRIAKVAWVDTRFFETLGVSMRQGRSFRDGEATTGMVPLSGGQGATDTAPVTVLTHGAWQRLFGGDPAIIGRTIRLNDIARTVVGVLPAGFVGPMGAADFYLAFDVDPVAADPIANRGSQWLGLIGRLKRARTEEEAQREVAAIGVSLAREYPTDDGTMGVSAATLRDALVGDTRTPLVVLMASALVVLMIACANLAGALLSRAIGRRTEFSARAALGAGRSRLARQILTETTVLAAAGGVAGLLLAAILLNVLRTVVLPGLPVYADLSLDVRAVLATTALAIGAGILFGAMPAVSLSATASSAALRGASRGASEGRGISQLRGALVAGQLALCVTLLAAAGLLTRSLWTLTTDRLGFAPDGVLTAGLELPLRAYPDLDTRLRFLEQLGAELRSRPGVAAVAYASAIPTRVDQHLGFQRADRGVDPRDRPLALGALVSDGYFATLGIPLRQGRTFDTRDRAGSPRVVVISESTARRYWPDGDALGARIRLGPNQNGPTSEIVGIVGDVRNDRARPDAEPIIYASSRQRAMPTAWFLIRARQGDAQALAPLLGRQVAALDAGLPLRDVDSLRSAIGGGLIGRRFATALLAAFGALALLLASVGVYAMFSAAAAAREREFGVRLALGSAPRGLAWLVVRQGIAWLGAGLSGGVIGIVVVTKLVSGLLYRTSPADPTALAAAVAVLMACAAVALFIPMRRAMRIDPIVALRTQ